MVKVILNGTMDKLIMVNGNQEQRMDTDYGKVQTVVYMKEIGKWINNMEKGNMFIQQALIKANLSNH